MIKRSYVPPEFMKNAFNCPHCSVYSNQVWGKIDAKIDNHYIRIPDFMVSRCIHCLNFSVWKEGIPVYPLTSQMQVPNPDLPDDAQAVFQEARDIVNQSASAATAFLRQCFRILIVHLGGAGKNMGKDLDSLVEQGLNPKIKQNLEALRVVGDDAVDPLMIDENDDFSTAIQLSQLINIIATSMISQPKLLEDLNQKIVDAKNNTKEKPKSGSPKK